MFQDGQGTFVSPGIIIYLIIYSQNNNNYYASKIFQNNYKNVHYVSVCGFNSCLNIIIKLILYTSLITVFIYSVMRVRENNEHTYPPDARARHDRPTS